MDRIKIEGGRKLQGTVEISGAKNAALPLMVASLLGDSQSTLHNVPDLRDVETMGQVLRQLGAKVVRRKGVVKIDPSKFKIAEAPYNIVRKMRASVYVLGPMIARLGKAHVSLPGGCAIGPRPIDMHLRGMEALNAEIKLQHGYIVAENKGLRGATIDLMGPRGSSVGATCNIMMAAVLAKGKTIIKNGAREPEVQELARFLNAMGAHISGAGSSIIKIRGVKNLSGAEYTVIPDRIEVGTYMTAAAITRSEIMIHNCIWEHLGAMVGKLEEIGVEVIPEGKRVVRVKPGDKYKPVSITTAPYPGFPTDMQAQFTALLSIVEGDSKVVDSIYPQRFIHVSELTRMGADIKSMDGFVMIRGVGNLSSAPIMASDLRASAALIIAGLAAEGETEVLRVYHIDRGYEHIEQKLAKLGASIRRVDSSGKIVKRHK